MDDDIDEGEIKEALEYGLRELSSDVPFQEKIYNFIESFKKTQIILYMIIKFAIVSPIQAAYNDFALDLVRSTSLAILDQNNSKDYKVIEKNIKIEITNEVNINIESEDIKDKILRTYGYVSTDKLIIKQSNNIKSTSLYSLEFGQVVKILHKNKKWTLVEYQEGEIFIEGWVFTRYISKFK